MQPFDRTREGPSPRHKQPMRNDGMGSDGAATAVSSSWERPLEQLQRAGHRIDILGQSGAHRAGGQRRHAAELGAPGVPDQRAGQPTLYGCLMDSDELLLRVHAHNNLGKAPLDPRLGCGIDFEDQTTGRLRFQAVGGAAKNGGKRSMGALGDHLPLSHAEILAEDDHLLGFGHDVSVARFGTEALSSMPHVSPPLLALLPKSGVLLIPSLDPPCPNRPTKS